MRRLWWAEADVSTGWQPAHVTEIAPDPGNPVAALSRERRSRRDVAALQNLLARQEFVITVRQAHERGLGKNTAHRRAAVGQWQRLLPGVYLAGMATPTAAQREIAAILYAGRSAVLTGLAALRRHGMREARRNADIVDVLVPATRRRLSAGFVVVHQTRRLPDQVCYRGPVQFVLPARAVADAARTMGNLSQVRAIVAAAVQTGLCTVEQICAELASGPVRGSALLRAATDEVSQGVRSAPEADLLNLIKRGHLPMPMFNPRLFVGAELLAKPDAWWPDLGIVVEVDSKEWHLSPQGWEQTMRRHARLAAHGVLVLHFSPRQIREEPQDVLSTIRAALSSRDGKFSTSIRTVPAG